MSVFHTQALHLLCTLADSNEDGKLEVPVRLILDDFASGARIPDFDKLILVIRSRDISVSVILQSLTQLETMYRLFVAMPSRKDENGIFRDIIHPIDAKTRDEFERVILNAYENYIKVEEILNRED